MNIDTIVMDVDDTLVGNDGILTEYTLRVLKECMRRGIRVIPASGRTRGGMRPIMDLLETGLPYICGNGTELVDGNHEYLEQMAIDQDTLKDICRFLEKRELYFHVYHGGCFYYEKECDESRSYAHLMKGLEGKAVGRLSEFVDFTVPKLIAISTPETIASLLPEFRKEFEGRAFSTISKPVFLEVMPIGASKGNALARLSEMLGLDPEKMLVFGDSLNDIPMITFTPNGVAMGNARDEVKAAARYVCGKCTENGLARFLEENVLKGVVG